MGKHRFLRAFAVVVLFAGCIAASTFLFSAAYDAGVLSAVSSRASSAKSARPVSSAASSAPPSAASGASAKTYERDLVLVSPEHPIPSWYKANLTDSFGVTLDSSVVQPFADMRTDASKDGVSLWVSSAYRSSKLQSELFQREIEEYSKTCPTYADAVAAAERSVAKPGCSEHETGLALDLNGVQDDFDKTAAFRWLDRHAQDYGFILRYPKDKQNITKIKYEPWHYRYVGAADAKAMKKAGLCLEEYEAQKTGAVH
jgi:D-alanyl-D-alanine carboxypeptidase